MTSLRVSILVALPTLALLASCGDGSPPYSGTVFVSQLTTGTGTTSVLSGSFVQLPLDVLQSAAIEGCTVRESGSCRAVSCAGASSLVFVGAGELTLSVAGSTALTATPTGTTNSYSATAPAPIFSAGQVVTISAAGGAVDAFTLQTTAPAAVSATVPGTVSRRAPLTVSWAPVDADEIGVSLVSSSSGTTAIIISCTGLPASGGSVTIASELLAELPSGGALVAVVAQNLALTDVGDYRVRFGVAEGSFSSATVTD